MAITRNFYIPLIDKNKMLGTGTPGEYDFMRVDKSTIFSLAYNPQTETVGYIDAAADTTNITGYQMSLPEEIKIDESLDSFRTIDAYFRNLPIGADAVVPTLICRPIYEETDGKWVLATDKWDGALYTEATVVPDTEDITGGMKYTFTLNLNGDPLKGTVTKDEDGNFVFNDSATATPPAESGGEETVSTYSLDSSSSKSKSSK